MSTTHNGRTNVSELRERIVKLGGAPKGRTIADLLDELEALIGSGEGGSLTPADVVAIVEERLPDLVAAAVAAALEDMEPGELDNDDFDDIFNP